MLSPLKLRFYKGNPTVATDSVMDVKPLITEPAQVLGGLYPERLKRVGLFDVT